MCVRSISNDGWSVVLAAFERRLERVEVVGDVAEFDDVPAVGPEAGGHVVVGGQVGRAVDRDLVVVEDADQVAEPEMAGEIGAPRG